MIQCSIFANFTINNREMSAKGNYEREKIRDNIGVREKMRETEKQKVREVMEGSERERNV